ncbi:TetR/AcrR family transcriptional regulator [Kitasatospora sp. NPDC054939]
MPEERRAAAPAPAPNRSQPAPGAAPAPVPEPERGRYGPRRPRPGLTAAGVVAAGRRVIERDGIDALTMRSVATELGTAPASLYRHVADRDALLLAVLEQIAEGLPVDVPGGDPATRLLRRLVDAHDYMAGHAWVLHILIKGELVAANALAFNDACLADLRAAGLAPAPALAAFRACWQLVLGELLSEHPVRPPREPSQRRALLTAVDPERLPALAEALAADPYRGPGAHCDRLAPALRALIGGLLAAGTRNPTA